MSITPESNNQPLPNWLIEVSLLDISPLNARKTVSEDASDEMKASILAHGLMQNLVVTAAPGGRYHVIAGGRRLEALKALQAEGKLPADHAVPCQVVTEEEAPEMSAAENMIREDMHPADEFEAFASLQAKGKTAAQVAARFGTTEKHVLQRMKLGRVAPALLAAYREEDLTLDCLMAYALTDDQQKQISVYESLSDWDRKSVHSVRRALMDGTVNGNDKLARFVGLEAYVDAGGHTRSDLFNDRVYLENPDLLHRLAGEKLDDAAEGLRREGWSWVEIAADCDWSFLHRCEELDPQPIDVPPELTERKARLDKELETAEEAYQADDGEDGDVSAELERRFEDLQQQVEEIDEQIESLVAFTPEQMAVSGCYVYVGDGDLVVSKGLVKPGEKKAAAKTENDDTAPAAPKGMPESLKRDLEAYRLGVAQGQLARHPAIAFDLLVFKVAKNALTMRGPIDGPDVSFSRNYAFTASADARDFIKRQAEAVAEGLPTDWLKHKGEAEQFEAFQSLSDYQKQALLAYCVAVTLKPKLGTGKDLTAYDLAVAQTGANVADFWRPGAANFLGRLGKAQLLELGEELFGENFTRRWANAKKSELVAVLDKGFANAENDDRPAVRAKLKCWLPEGMAFVAPEAEPDGLQRITIRNKDHEPMEIEALVKDGLAVHKTLVAKGDGEALSDTLYSVTHIGTGGVIDPGKPFDIREDAIGYRDKMLSLGDWSFIHREDAPEGLFKAAQKVRDSWGKPAKKGRRAA